MHFRAYPFFMKIKTSILLTIVFKTIETRRKSESANIVKSQYLSSHQPHSHNLHVLLCSPIATEKKHFFFLSFFLLLIVKIYQLNCCIPCHWFAHYWIRIVSIAFWLVLTRTPLNSNDRGGVFSSYSRQIVTNHIPAIRNVTRCKHYVTIWVMAVKSQMQAMHLIMCIQSQLFLSQAGPFFS